MEQTSELLLKRLRKPSGTVDVVLDTDTFNEIDDQYALAYLIRSDDKLNLKAIYAAPFQNDKAPSPKQGMEMSYDEILRILSLMKRDDLKSKVYKGSDAFLQSETQPVVSDAAKNLVKLARESAAAQKPLYVIAIGAITNVASALLLEPEIKNSIVLIWLGGHAHDWPDNKEFNLYEDIAAARIVFGCGVPLVQLPCMGVVSAFTTSGPELEYWLKGKNALCDYLVDVTKKEALKYGGGPCWTREIWDVAAVAWLLDGDFMLDRLEHSPIPTYDGTYSIDRTRHLIKYVYHIKRDNLFYDLFSKLAK
ncbi:MAG: nucleoside hydrolase [Termitinemataceae bacterium]|nr:MAG: nucleoside hydrolase [Termitinemataceae bacterium]